MKGIDISNLEDIIFFIRKMIWKGVGERGKYGVFQLTPGFCFFFHVLNVAKKVIPLGLLILYPLVTTSHVD